MGGSKVLSRGEEEIYILSPLLSIHSVLALYYNHAWTLYQSRYAGKSDGNGRQFSISESSKATNSFRQDWHCKQGERVEKEA